CLDAQDLRLFLETEQGLSLATTEGCLELLRRFEPSAAGRERVLLGLDGFTRYLQSAECQLLDPEHQNVCQDMKMPLSHYFISASYRSYLLDDQVHGRADLGGLIRALQVGCRCLELGVTDGPEGEPLLGVDHGTDGKHHHHHHHHHGSVTLRSALEVINKYAFLTSQYPLLLYLCQRCSPSQQRTLAQHLKKVFGPKLHTPESLPVSLGGRATILPSPEQLKGKVLLVGKKLPPEEEGSEGEVSEEDEEIGASACGEAGRLASESPEELVNFTKRCLTRVRPSSVRLDSSNPNPQGYWKGGVQLVALNQQTPGAMLDLTRGRFMQNGGCGYVLRPAVMREEVSYFSAQSQGCVPGVPPQTLRVKVISAHSLPKPQGSGAKGEVIDPYVVLELHGVPADCTEQRTRTANFAHLKRPKFTVFSFQVNMPELALLRFVVLDDDYIGDDFIGQYTILEFAFRFSQHGFSVLCCENLDL
uniref:Phosphoinositide phospholipase C n=1 Tax=Cyprinus carpio TaxID=7962 RepID=A0A8C2K2Y6_CYPCA